jgi:hypothetical protein
MATHISATVQRRGKNAPLTCPNDNNHDLECTGPAELGPVSGTKTSLTLGAFAILSLLVAGVSYWVIRESSQSGPPPAM